MALIQPPQDQFEDDCRSCLCWFCTWPPLSACAPLKLPFESSCPLIVKGGASRPLDMSPPSPPVAGLRNKTHFLFHRPCLSGTGVRAASSRARCSVTLSAGKCRGVRAGDEWHSGAFFSVDSKGSGAKLRSAASDSLGPQNSRLSSLCSHVQRRDSEIPQKLHHRHLPLCYKCEAITSLDLAGASRR